MKLRLPHGLRKALLACLAAVASLAPLSVTLASGSLCTGMLSFILASSPVQATDITWKGGDGATWKTGDSSNWWISGGGDAGNANFSDNDEVTFSFGQLTDPQTITLGSAVTAGNITLDGGEWIFTNGGNAEFVLTLAGDIELRGSEAGPTGDFSAVSVTLSGSGPHEFIGKGTITFGSITGDGNGWTIGNGTDATTVKLTSLGAAADDHNFGAVEVQAGSKLVLGMSSGDNAPSDAWGSVNNGANYVYGEGTVVITGAQGGKSKSDILTRLFSADPTGGKPLARLELGDGTDANGAYLWVLNSSGITNADLNKRLTTISVTAGSTLLLDGANPFDNSSGSHAAQNDHFIELAGGGSKGLTSTLHANGTSYVSWAVKLMDDSVHLGSNSTTHLYLYGKFLAEGHTFTVSGSSNVHLLGEIDYGSAQGLKVTMSGTYSRSLYLGSNGASGKGVIAELNGGSGAVNQLYAETGSSWTLNSIVQNTTGFMFGGGGTWNFAEGLIKDMQGGGTITLGDGTNATKFVGTITIPAAGCGKWIVSDLADVSEFSFKLEGLEISADDVKDPFWSHEFQGAIPLSLLKPMDGTLEDGQTFGRSTDGNLVIQSATAGLPTEELSFSTGDKNWNTAKKVGTSSGSTISYDYDSQQDYNGEGVTWQATNSGDVTATWSGADVKRLKFQRTGANGSSTINGLPENLTDLWLDWSANNATGAYFTLGNFQLPNSLKDIYSSGAALYLCQSTDVPKGDAFQNITFHLGKVNSTNGLSSQEGFTHFAIWTQDDITVAGLEMQESGVIITTGGKTFTVGNLTGNGDLRVASTGNATLAVTDGANFKGHVDFIFQQKSPNKLTIAIADGQTLTTAGIASTNNNDGNIAASYGGGGFAVQDGGTSATVKVLGSNPEAALGITFGEGVTLEIAAGASQAFGHHDTINTEISKLKGEGALGVAGNVTVKALDNYTGEVHLWNGGALTVGVAGSDDADSASTGTLSKLVLRDGESTLNVHGAWTLKGLELLPGASAGKLTIGQGTTGDSLAFGEGNAGIALSGSITLHFGSGVGYSGKLSIDVDNDSKPLLEIQDILGTIGAEESLFELGISLTGLQDAGLDWAGFKLFNPGEIEITPLQVEALSELLSDDSENFNVRVRPDGTVYLRRATVLDLTWKGEQGDLWKEGYDTTKWTKTGGEDIFAEGDNVIFEKLADQEQTTVTVSGTVHAGNVTVGSDDQVANYTFSADADEPAELVEIEGTVTLKSDSSATFNTDVKFSGVTPSIAGLGTVTFGGKISGSGAGLTIGDGSKATEVHISTADSADFKKHLGNIEIKESSSLWLSGGALDQTKGDTDDLVASGWGSGNVVWGAGTVVLDREGSVDIGGQSKALQYLMGSFAAAKSWARPEGLADASNNLGNLRLHAGTTVCNATNEYGANFIAYINNIWVEDGASFMIATACDNGYKTNMNGDTHIFHLEGKGRGDGNAESDFNHRTDANLRGAFIVTNNQTVGLAWKVMLEDSNSGDSAPSTADIRVDAGSTLNITGDFDAQKNSLVKSGGGLLNLGSVLAGADHAGSIAVAGGTLEISGSKPTDADTLVATTVDLDNSTGDGTGTFKVSGSGKTYTVQKVVMGDGATNNGGLNGTCNAHLTAGEGTTLVVQGDNGVALQMMGDKAGWIDGGGTVQLNGKATGSGRIVVGDAGTKLIAGVQWDDYSGGLYLHGGTLQLGADVQVGWLGGTNDGYGGHITASDTTDRTITVTGSGGEAKGVEAGEHVKLKINDGITQNLIDLTGEGTLELGAGATSTVSGESTIGSITNAGTLNLYKNKEQVTLEVNGKVTTTGNGSIWLGTGGDTSNASSAVTVNGDLELNGKDTTYHDSLYIQDGTFTVTGQISGTTKGDDGTCGDIRMNGGTLKVQGSGEAAYDGWLLMQGKSTLELGNGGTAGKLTVGGINGNWNGDAKTAQALVKGNGELVLNVEDGITANGNVGSGLYGLLLVVSEKAHLTKAGKGTQVLSALKTEGNDAYVEVTDGILQFKTDNAIQERTVIDVKDLRVTGTSSVLDFARQDLPKVDGSNNLTLSGGGKLQSSYAGSEDTQYSFGSLTVGEGGGSIVQSDSAKGMQRFSFDSLSGEGNLDLTKAFGGKDGATKHSLNLGEIKGYSGTVSVSGLDSNNELTVKGNIVSGEAKTHGKIEVTGDGAVTLNGGGAVLKKTGGEGEFTISDLKISSGQGLQMDYAGGKLSITELTLEAGTGLYYTAAAVGEDATLTELAFSNFSVLFGSGWKEGDTIRLVTEGIDRGGAVEELYLGIIAESADEIANWSEEVLAKYFIDDSIGDPAELLWKEEGGKQKLYLSLLSTEEAVRYWDGAWDDGSGPGEETRGNGPNNKRMQEHGDLWYKVDDAGKPTTDCAWSQMEHRDDSTDFTQSALQLGGEGGKWNQNKMNYVRLGKGSSNAGINEKGSKLTVLGGKLYNTDAKAETGDGARVYISLWAPETEYFHLLVGGSSFVGSGLTDAGFTGNTHIQVQGGTVDHIVGGNHVTNSDAFFDGNTYISVYEGGSEHNEQGVPDMDKLHDDFGTNVRGGIVGGSTVTSTHGTLSGEEKTYDFLGHSHIYIYTVLRSARDAAGHAVTISDGNGNAADDTELYHIVGGNAWIGLPAANTDWSMVFSGSSNITIDLRHYQNFYHKNAERGGMDFEKAIVGGNFSSIGASSETDTGTRSTLFEYNTHGEAAQHPYAVQIVVNGTAKDGTNVAFLGGINGASRRDNAGAGTTVFNAGSSKGIDIELTGGAYRNYVAGGFWFGGSRVGDSSGEETHEGKLTSAINVSATGGEYWRVVGGSVSFNGTAGSTGDTTGDTQVTVSGDAKFGLGWDLTSGIPVQETAVGQDTVALVIGGSYLQDTQGVYTQDGKANVTITGGTFNNTHIVAGDYVYSTLTEKDSKTESSVTLKGGTTLTLGDEEGKGKVSVNGLVVGGSYITDKGKGGKAIIGTPQEGDDASYKQTVTHVTVNGGVTLNAETDEKGNTLHDGVALVAGSVLIDEEGKSGAASQGGHRMEIYGGTQLDITGGTINGTIVGGSYSAHADGGSNELIIHGNSAVNIAGGEIHGNVYGGHYSANAENPDHLTLGNVTVTMSGGTVDGYIFGGSFRNAHKPVEGGESPVQGALTVDLQSGTLTGGVFAAGDHFNEGDGALHVRTESTRIKLSSKVTLQPGEEDGTAREYVMLSGGYLRSNDGAAGGTSQDYSTVGYDEKTQEWNATAAVLEFTDSGESYAEELKSLPIHLQDFDAVQVDSGNLVLDNTKLLVMHKVSSADDKGNHDSFTKLGSGNLTLGQGLSSRNAQTEAAETFTGRFIVEGGELVLGHDGTNGVQSLEGGLTFRMYDANGAFIRSAGNKDNAYLRGINGTVFGRGNAKDPIDVSFDDKTLKEGLPTVGVYYLVDGLSIEGLTRDNLSKYFKKAEIGGSSGTVKYDLDLRDGDKLVLRVHDSDPSKWIWEGTGTGTWTQRGEDSDKLDEWTKESLTENEDLGGADYYFNAGAAEDGEVKIDGAVSAGRIFVSGGDYDFVQGGTGEGLSVGTITVGAEGAPEGEAHLKLSLANKSVGSVILEDGGWLELAHAAAIQTGENGTNLSFNGGTLKYGEVDGQLALGSDLSGQVAAGGKDAIRIQVGDSAEEQTNAPAAAAETDVPFSVTWVGDANNNGIKQAAGYGLIKTGRGGFVLQTSGVDNFAGTLEAQEGTLELKAGGAVIDIKEAEGTKLLVEQGATLILAASGEGSGVTVNRAFSGTGTVVIGENAQNDQATTYTLAAGNSGFAGTVRLAGNGTNSTVKVTAAGALGGENTTLALAGRAIVAAKDATSVTSKDIMVEDGTVNLVGGYGKDTEKSYTLTTGTVTGSGVLANAQGGFRVELSASDLSGFTGVLVAGKQGVGSEGESTWTLTGTLANPEVATSLAGTGTVEIAFGSTTKATTPVVLTGTIGDGALGNTVNVENAMAGTALVLGGGVSGEKADTKAKNTSGGNLIFDNGNEIWLGDEGHAGSWVGGVSGTGRFVLRDGVLGKALTNLGDVTLSVDTAVKAGDGTAWVNAGGTAGSLFKDITVNARGRLRNVTGDITVGKSNTKLTLYFDETGIGTEKGKEEDYLIGSTGNLVVNEVTRAEAEGAPFVLDFSNDGLLDILKTHRKDEVRSYLHLLTGGTIQFGKTPTDQQQALDSLLRTGNYTTLLSALGFTLGVDGGDLTLLGSSKDVYLVLGDDPENQGDPHTVTDPGDINDKKAVLVDENTTLTLDDPDNGTAGKKKFTLRNLVGLEGSTLAAGDEAGKDDITVTFDNSTLLPADEEQANDPWLGELTDPEVYGRLQGLDTEFDGTIVGNGENVNFEKEGAGTLTVGSESGTGGMDIDGTLTLKEGDVVLRGDATEDGSRLGGLTFRYTDREGGGLTVQGARLTVDDITVDEGSDPDSNNVDITENGELVYGGKNGGVLENLHLKSSDESGTLSTDGTLTLGSGSDITGLDVRLDAQQSGDEQQSTGGKLVLQDDAEMHARAVELGDKGQLDLSGSTGKHTVESLSGTAGSILSGGTGTDLTVTGTGGNFSGTLSGGGKLTVAKDAEFTLENVTTDAPDTASAWGIDVQSGGTFTLDTSEQHGDAGPRFGDVVFAGGSDVTLKFDYNADGGTTAHMNSLTFGDGSSLTLESTSESPYTGNPDRIVIGYAANGEDVTADVDITLKGVSFLHFEADEVYYDSRTGEYYVGTKQVSRNLFAAALPHREKNAMAGAELFWSASSPGSPALKEALKNPEASDLLRMLAGLTAMKDSGDASGLARALAAGAGASISVLGPALAEDIHRQLMSIRSRATGVMDDMQTDGYDAYPFWHAWITGEGGYRKLDADGFAPGYTLNNWGGSVGADATLSQRTSVGLAITAMYGDLKPEASDSATGDLDTVYLSGYLRHASGAWSHTFALSMGVSDIKLDRTVTYGLGSYRTHGNTDGLSFGVLYEIGYSRFVNKSGSFVLQPIANVELRHAMINGYTETGSDAGLQVDDIEQTVLTFGAGVRVQGLIGQQTFNHDALVEARALVKADVGDRSGTSRHAIIRDTTHAEVESAEVGAVGVETGVGLSIPLGLNAGSIILDGSVEFRSGWTSANASVGYRISF